MTGPEVDDARPVGADATRRRAGRRRRARLLGGVLLAGLGAVLLACLLQSGTTAFVIESPSMGRAAPVGTLVIAQPAPFAQLRVGDVVTYRAAGAATTITHRVVGISAEGLQMRGDINGASDGLPVRPSMVIGRAVLIIPGAGTLIRLAPWMAVGVVSVWLLTWALRGAELRAGLRLVGVTAVTTVLVVLQHPLAGWTVLTQQPVARAVLASIVSTGLLPIKLQAWHGAERTAAPGQVVDLLLPTDPAGRVRFDVTLGLEPWGWALLVLACLSPLIAVLVFGLPDQEDDPPERPA